MFTKAIITTLLTLLLTTVGFTAESARSAPQSAPAVAVSTPQSTAPLQSQAVQTAPDASKPATPAAPAPQTKVKPNRAITITMFMVIIG
ncbi:MAG TPA: cation acetate symporter, partial [Geobacteraceae bacterium]|nr:cation acetate symporter [Geobacteraceae bacterium]